MSIAAAGIVTTLSVGGCELALHEVQQAQTSGCDPWQTGCTAVGKDAAAEPSRQVPVDRDRMEILHAALDAPYRPCNGVGLVCQGRIIGDVLRDQYIMVLAGQSEAASTAASAERLVPSGGPRPPAAAPAVAPEPAPAPSRIIRTQGSRLEDAGTPAQRR